MESGRIKVIRRPNNKNWSKYDIERSLRSILTLTIFTENIGQPSLVLQGIHYLKPFFSRIKKWEQNFHLPYSLAKGNKLVNRMSFEDNQGCKAY